MLLECVALFLLIIHIYSFTFLICQGGYLVVDTVCLLQDVVCFGQLKIYILELSELHL